jgi:hypothetical protein
MPGIVARIGQAFERIGNMVSLIFQSLGILILYILALWVACVIGFFLIYVFFILPISWLFSFS